MLESKPLDLRRCRSINTAVNLYFYYDSIISIYKQHQLHEALKILERGNFLHCSHSPPGQCAQDEKRRKIECTAVEP